MISRSLSGFLAFSILICVFGKVSFGRSSEPDREMEQVTYLGVRTESLPSAMSKQLSLPMGLHLSVVRVGPDSPAEKAGLREFDVLLKLDEQILVNEDQLKKLVRLQRPQDPITLKVLREGKLLNVVVVLEETQVPKETYSSSRNPLMYDRSNRPMRNPFLDDELLKDFWDDRFEDFMMKDPNFGLRNKTDSFPKFDPSPIKVNRRFWETPRIRSINRGVMCKVFPIPVRRAKRWSPMRRVPWNGRKKTVKSFFMQPTPRAISF